MSQESTQLSSTTSLCPTCLERVPSTYETRNDAVYLTRSCPKHGTTSCKVWESLDHWEWASDFGSTNETDASTDLTVDGDHACLAVVEITQDCNLSCSYCFASSGPGGTQLPFEDVIDLLDTVREEGGTRPIQFSGGEPTVHDELPELVEHARQMGFEHIEVNTNGIELARQEGYAERLAEAGVTAIYLQFDGITRETYEEIREVDLLDIKYRALNACRRADLPVILVPTIVPGTNDDEMGDIVRFALDNLDIVQSINFQPVAHFGRYAENEGRFSLDEAARCLATQIEALEPRDFLPVPCCSSYCQMSTAVISNDEGDVVPLTGLLDLDNWETLSGLVDETDWMELLAGTPVGHETVDIASSCCGIDVPSGGNVLPVTLTGFMDADAADVDRLDNCCITVPTPDGDLVPFCAYNMTTEDGRYELRNRHSWGGRDTVGTDESGDGVAAIPVDTDEEIRDSSAVQHSLEALLHDPWRMLDTVLDGPLHPGGRDATDDLLDRAGVDSETRLLDIGCGTGNALGLARDRGTHAIGLDRQPTEASAVQGDLTSLPFHTNSFDVVLGECVLCLSPDLGQTLDDIERLLKPGGCLALSDVTVAGTPPELPPPLDEALCLTGSRERSHIRQQIEHAGFEIDGIQTHRDDLLSMRDRLRDAFDYDRLADTLGDRGTHIHNSAKELDNGVESGRIGYVSIIATNIS